MATLTAVDIRMMIEAAVRGALSGQQASARDGAGGSGHLDERRFRRVEKFDGSEGEV
jgi:hypothetical protein